MDILGRITKLVIQRCEACGRVFPVLYKARFDSSSGVFVSDGYDYVGETCDCKADFAPDEGDPSISEWVDSLNATRHKAVTDHAVLFEMELDASPTASELQTILNLFEPTEHLVPIDMAANNSYAVGFMPDSLANLLDYDLRYFKQAISKLMDDECLLMDIAATKGLPHGALYEVVVKDIPTYIFRNLPDGVKE